MTDAHTFEDEEPFFEDEHELRANLVATYDEEEAEEILPELLKALPGRLSDHSAQDVVDLAYKIQTR
ncbi:hypothetical protein BBK82_03470 [Lentzea guizhouensis]|uniref:Uncharacterized protein n=1 Tax=Lentzea guizhouensis TaxID=1586287 RepID=A0A1B2HC25_9PSEU|nr:hypothetical protein [Lentzea guizhouensis]ANZ35275.1 hypothetical protein BBK82_03470 [Lentzea guizhouensis]